MTFLHHMAKSDIYLHFVLAMVTLTLLVTLVDHVINKNGQSRTFCKSATLDLDSEESHQKSERLRVRHCPNLQDAQRTAPGDASIMVN